MRRIAHNYKITLVTSAIAVLAVAAWVAQPVLAQVFSHQQLKVDDSIALDDSGYSVPTQIVVVPLFPPDNAYTISDTDWFRGLYYFSIANDRRSGFTDVPFHYVVSSTGEIFKGNSGGEERKISIDGLGDDFVVIGYLAGKSDNAFDPRAVDALSGLVLDVANRQAIPMNKVQVATVYYQKNDELKTISIKKQQLYGLWNTSISGVLDKIRKQYAPVPKQYQAQVVAVSLPTTEVKPGETVVGSITIKNVGDTGIYPDTISAVVGSFKGGAVSKFYLPEFWASTSQFNLLAEDGTLLPGAEKKFDFRLNVPLYFGAQAEEFELKTVGGQKVAGGDFSLTLNVGRPEGVTVVEVGPTETGWLRVRATASSAAAEVARISTGERYYQIGDAGNGWVQLRLNDGREGWVSKLYLRYP